ncbi:unnamed protein product [Blepharisma stoltei]|uniref:RRM domain-containing protein n=1 Tax=Blepharisma stoltei TaxID=1481888 RepID=A0AAU9K4G4_9CILI|nr:unnamed protein product [Blepharisma stoltei]
MPRSSSSSYTSSSGSCCSSSSRSPSPRSKVLRVTNLTGNVNRNHLYEIFENYGEVKTVELAEKEGKEGRLKRGYAYVDMVSGKDALAAKKAMDGGWIDGNVIGVSIVDEYRGRRRPRSRYNRYKRSRPPINRRKRSRSCSCSSSSSK